MLPSLLRMRWKVMPTPSSLAICVPTMNGVENSVIMRYVLNVVIIIRASLSIADETWRARNETTMLLLESVVF